MNKNKLKRLADYAVREGTEHTTDGRWSVSYDELYYHFGEGITDANEIPIPLPKTETAKCSMPTKRS